MTAKKIIPDKLTFYGACEGLQESLYFKHLKKIINEDDKRQQTVEFKLKIKPGSPHKTCIEANKSVNLGSNDDLKKNKLVISIFDNDFKDESFKDAINYCQKENIQMGYSNINFDLWLILHKKYYKKQVNTTDGYVSEVKKVYHLSKNDDIKNEETINKIMEQISIEDIKFAIDNAKKLEEENAKIGKVFMKSTGHYEQPSLRINDVVEYIMEKVYEKPD